MPVGEVGRAARPKQASTAFRLAAAALAAAPVGFAGGALLGARLLLPPAAASGLAIAACGLFGAIVGALVAGGAALSLSPRAGRWLTLVVGGASFAVLVYLVRDFVVDRMAQNRAFDAAYAAVPAFAFTVATEDPYRRPFSQLAYESTEHVYSAVRPGGWRCAGNGRRQDHVALFEALRRVSAGTAETCPRRLEWRIGDNAAASACLPEDAPLLVVAATMTEATARRASCRRLGE